MSHLPSPLRSHLPAMLMVVAVAGCPTTEPTTTFTLDQRIDMAGDEDNRVQSEKPQMCVNSLGHVFVMWADNRAASASGTVATGSGATGEKQVLWMNRSLSFGDVDTWLPAPARINQGDGNVAAPRMICDDNGVYVVWQDDRDGELRNPNIYFQSSVDGEVWATEDVRISPDPDGDTLSINPDIAIDQSGTLYVVWADSESGSYDIKVGTSVDGGASWGPNFPRVDQDSPGSGWSGNPRIAVAPSGEYVWVTWMDKRDGKSDIYVAYSDSAGASFRPEERIDNTLQDADGLSDSFEPKLCTDGSGPVYVVWHDNKLGENNDIYFNYSPDLGASWNETAQRLDSKVGKGNSRAPQCVANGVDAYVAWEDNRNNGFDVFYRSINAGLTSTIEEVRLDVGTQPGTSNSIDVRMARTDDTYAVAWTDGRAEAEAATGEDDGRLGYADLYYNYAQNGGAFQTAQDYRIDSLLPGQSSKKDLSIALLGGEIYATWEDGRGGTKDIYFQRHLLGEEGTPPPVEDQGDGQ